jgi:hypothetical protein
LGTDPAAADSDSDSLDDARELALGTDPTAADTDGDGYPDAREVAVGTDPTAATGALSFWWARVTAGVPGGGITVLGIVGVLAVALVLAAVLRRRR